MQILEKIKEIRSIDINPIKLKEYFNKLTPQEIEVSLDFLKNLDFYRFKIENFEISNEESMKNLFLVLALKNEIKNNFEEPKKVEVELLKAINSLEEETKYKTVKIYLSKGIHILKSNIDDIEFKYKKIILKHFHDLGGFENSIWGIKINYDLFLDLTKNIDYSLVEKLENKIKVVNKDSFIMLINLF